MAYRYEPSNYNIYDINKTFKENYNNEAVITKKKLDKIEEGIKLASADFAVDKVRLAEVDEEPSVKVTFDSIEGTHKMSFVIPRGLQGEPGDIGPTPLITVNSVTKGDTPNVTVDPSSTTTNVKLNFVLKDGYTPQRGIDYFTEEDITEFLGQVNDETIKPYVDEAIDTKFGEMADSSTISDYVKQIVDQYVSSGEIMDQLTTQANNYTDTQIESALTITRF